MRIKDHTFDLFISEKEIQEAVARLADRLNHDFRHLNPLFIGILNGAFMFAADLLRNIHIPSELTFVKVKSYAGTQSTGKIKALLGLDHNIQDRHLIILEDIIDTGLTILHLQEILNQEKPASIHITTLLLKPEALLMPLPLTYVGFEIPNEFVVGYGLDYDGQGRNLRDIYKVSE